MDDLAKALDVDLEEIYEPHDGIYIVNNGNENENFGNYNHYHAHSELAFETIKKNTRKIRR